MNKLLALSGLVIEGDVQDDDYQELKDQVAELGRQLRNAQTETAKARADAARSESAAKELRRQLGPLHNALRLLFGEIDSIAPGDVAPASSSPATPASNAKWESWKQRLPGRPAEFIDLLLIHDSLSVKQVCAATRCGKDAVYTGMDKLRHAGIAQNIGGRYSLKEI